MGLIVVLPIAILAGWSIWRIYRWVHGADFDSSWHRRFQMFALAGIALGVWFLFLCAYNVARIRIESFPIPTAIWNRDNPDDLSAPLIRHVLPALIRVPAAITDLLFGTALGLAPLAFSAFIKDNKGRKDFAGPRGGLSG